MSLDTKDIGADDLDDGLAYDVDLSEPETQLDPGSDFEVDATATTTPTATATPKTPEPKKRKKTSKLQDKKRVKMEMDIEQKKNLSKETGPEVIADFINNRIRHKNPDLSAIELAELYFNKSDIRSTADFEDERDLEGFSKFIVGKFKNMLPAKKGKPKKNKKEKSETEDETEERKFIAIVSMSALRACDVHRATKDISGSSLKIINKNKIEVDLKLVKTTRSRVLCCTPGRLIKVLNSEDLELSKDEIKIIIVDNSYLDGKKQNIWDIKETPEVLKTLSANGSKMYLY
jgi:protein CMS1